MRIFGKSEIGPLHVRENLPNQDSFLCKRGLKISVAAVSDGLGSRKSSDTGSRAACEAALKSAREFFRKGTGKSVRDLLESTVGEWKRRIQPNEPGDCSATCLFAVVGKKRIFTARLGDGMIALLGKESGDDVLITDRKGGSQTEFSNETLCLSDSRAVEEFEVKTFERKKYRAIVVTTDGISSDLKEGTELAFARELAAETRRRLLLRSKRKVLAEMMRNWPVKNHTDDKTIAIMEL